MPTQPKLDLPVVALQRCQFGPYGMTVHPEGAWTQHADAMAAINPLQEEVERLKAQRDALLADLREAQSLMRVAHGLFVRSGSWRSAERFKDAASRFEETIAGVGK